MVGLPAWARQPGPESERPPFAIEGQRRHWPRHCSGETGDKQATDVCLSIVCLNPVTIEEWHKALGDVISDKLSLSLDIQIATEARDLLTIDIEIPAANHLVKTVIVKISTSLIGCSGFFERNRLRLCLKRWLPACLQVQAMTGRSIGWRLSAADRGDEGALSMDGEERELLIPDLYAFDAKEQILETDNAYDFDAFSHEWSNRKSSIFWRGSSTGVKDQYPIATIDALRKNDRVKACAMFKGRLGFDLAISRIVQIDEGIRKEAETWMTARGLLASVVPEKEFSCYRHYVDLPGNGLAWGTIHKYVQGILVFRPNSNRHLSYYSLMKPWKHYIPVREDLEDLANRLEWANDNKLDAAMIAWRGKLAAISYLRRIDLILIYQLLSEAVLSV